MHPWMKNVNWRYAYVEKRGCWGMEGGRIGGGDRRGVRGIWEYGRGTPGCIEISGIFEKFPGNFHDNSGRFPEIVGDARIGELNMILRNGKSKF